MPQLDNSTGQEQTEAVSKALYDWKLDNKTQIMCCDSTASNGDGLNGAFVRLEHKLEREIWVLCLSPSYL